MKKDNCTMGRRRRLRRGGFASGSWRAMGSGVQPRWLLVVFAALGCWGLLAVRNGAEQVDSGWAIAIPSPLATGPATINLEQELVIRHVLEQTRLPLLKKPPSAQAATPSTEHSTTDVRFAARPEPSADGWRASGQSVGIVGPTQSSRRFTPQLGAAKPLPETDCHAEEDCSGGLTEAANGTAGKQSAEQTTPSTAGPTLSQPAAEATSSVPPTEAGILSEATDNTTEPAAEDTEAVGSADVTDHDTKDAQTDPPPSIEAKAPQRPVAKSLATLSPPATKKAPTIDVPPVNNLPPLTKQLTSLRNRVRAVLKGYYRKALNSRDNDPWEAMHGMLAYGVHSRIRNGGPNGELITSVGWLCYNKPCKGQSMLYVTPSGELRAKYGVGLQGHLGQFLAMLAQCKVSPDYPIHVGDHEFTIRDLIEAEKKTCYPKSELTFKLLALQHYADLNDKWENDQGIEWDFPRLVREELAQPIRGAACGGTHRLSALSLTVKQRIRRGEPVDGEYALAAEFVKKYQNYAFRLQNRDGSLSTSWFRGAGDEDDDDRRIKTTGHILEWLCYSLSDEELRDQRTIRAVTYLANLMYSNYDHEWEVGPMCHATHALLLYDQRVFQPFDKEGEVAIYRSSAPMTKRNQSGSSRR
jgi:hypothetical protein